MFKNLLTISTISLIAASCATSPTPLTAPENNQEDASFVKPLDEMKESQLKTRFNRLRGKDRAEYVNILIDNFNQTEDKEVFNTIKYVTEELGITMKGLVACNQGEPVIGMKKRTAHKCFGLPSSYSKMVSGNHVIETLSYRTYSTYYSLTFRDKVLVSYQEI